ncbi:MAG TPA: hypothetical protein VFZ23_18155, partial [Pyrinomonadaceae bacterium]
MMCPVCKRDLAPTLSICLTCGAMINDTVREELETKISKSAGAIASNSGKLGTGGKLPGTKPVAEDPAMSKPVVSKPAPRAAVAQPAPKTPEPPVTGPPKTMPKPMGTRF